MKLSIEICKIAIMAGHCDWADVKIEPQNLVVYREESGGKNGRGGGAMANEQKWWSRCWCVHESEIQHQRHDSEVQKQMMVVEGGIFRRQE